MIPRVYIDTSVIGGCIDDEFAIWSNSLFDEFRNGVKIAVVSDLTRRELEAAPSNVKKILSTISGAHIESVFLSGEAESLALNYLKNKVVYFLIVEKLSINLKDKCPGSSVDRAAVS